MTPSMITGLCKICKKEFPVAENAHPAFRVFCPDHFNEMLEEHDSMEVLE